MGWRLTGLGVYCPDCTHKHLKDIDCEKPVPNKPGQDHCSLCGAEHPDTRDYRDLQDINDAIVQCDDAMDRLGKRELFRINQVAIAIKICQDNPNSICERILQILTIERR